MNITEKILEMKETGELENIISQACAKEAYQQTELQLAEALRENLRGELVTCKSYGSGMVTEVVGTTFESVILVIDFVETVKKFSLFHIMHNKFVTFNKPEIQELWEKFFDIHLSLTDLYHKSEAVIREQQKEAKKLEEKRQKAEARNKQLKERVIKDFDKMAKKEGKEFRKEDDFYYALGWLANHIGAITATVPDYLEKAFVKQFGSEATYKSVDSSRLTSSGHSMQWTFSFKANLKKAEQIPAFLTPYLGSTGKSIASTSFIWTLVDDYGFKFGKEQDLEQIKGTIHKKYMDAFEAGLSA